MAATEYQIKEPKQLSDRIMWLRDYFFKGNDRKWNNEFTAWTLLQALRLPSLTAMNSLILSSNTMAA